MGHAVVIGGGIGGLSAAVGLRKAGWRVDLLERAARFTGIGAGIVLWPNALRGLEALGLGEALRPLVTPQVSGGMYDWRGTRLSDMAGAEIERALGSPSVALHRATLIELLRDALPADVLHTGVEVTDISPDGELRYAGKDPGVGTADLVVAADGINSRVRARLWPDHPAPRYSGTSAFRAVTTFRDPVRIGVTWGPGAEVGIVPLSDGRIYWYASFNACAGHRYPDPKTHLLDRLSDWHPPIPAVIEATPAGAILHHDTYHLADPLPSYVRGRVALLGDAAHAMTPFAGQGGCQAIEDAVVLAAAAARQRAVPGVLAEYDALRRPRSQFVARTSDRVGRFGQRLANPVAVALRNAALRLTPASVSVRGAARLSNWTPPAITAR